MNTESLHILRIDCPDAKGLVNKITGVLYHHDLNVIRNDEFVDYANSYFYMRTEFSGVCNEEKLMAALQGILPDGVTIALTNNSPKKVVLLATKEHHCLSDLLVRHEFNDLNIQILAVISNHEKLRSLTERFHVPFHFISHENKTREDHEQEILACVQSYNPEFLILAKYLRVLTAAFTANYLNKIINIHHSFLPAFIGANPYKQAFDRGVKIIGATAHFVNQDLDEGPIILQDVVHTNHTKTANDMAKAGRDVEKIVLAQALKLVTEDRIFVKDNKTIIFE